MTGFDTLFSCRRAKSTFAGSFLSGGKAARSLLKDVALGQPVEAGYYKVDEFVLVGAGINSWRGGDIASALADGLRALLLPRDSEITPISGAGLETIAQ